MPRDLGVKIARKNENVLTATGEELVFTSARNCLKLDEVQTTPITLDGSGIGSATVPHNLGFVPFVIMFINWQSVVYPVPNNDPSLGASPNATFYVTSSDLVISLDDFDHPSQTYDIYFFLSETESAS